MIIKKHLWKQFFLSQKQCHFSWLSFKISTSRCDVLQVMPASGCGTINRASAGGGEGNGNRSRVIFKVRQAAFGGFAPYLCCPYVMSQIQVEHSRAIEYLKFTWSPSAIDLAGQGLLVKPGNIRQPRPFWCLSLKLAFRNHKLLNILCCSRQRSARLMEKYFDSDAEGFEGRLKLNVGKTRKRCAMRCGPSIATSTIFIIPIAALRSDM